MKKCLLIASAILGMLFTDVKGQQVLQDIRPGMDGSDVSFETAVQKDGYLYFTATEGTYFYLYRTNGSSVEKVIGDNNLYVLALYKFLGNELLFVGGNFTDGFSLYKTNGSVGNSTLVKTLGDGNFANYLLGVSIVNNGNMYFIGGDNTYGYELWKTDGTEAGTVIVKDINAGSGNSTVNTATIGYFAALGNTIFFAAGDSTNGAELWKSDGTEAGTVLVKDINPDNTNGPMFGSNPAYLTAHNGKVYFSAFRASDGRELWVTDGTNAGTQLVKDIAPSGSTPSDLITYNGTLYFNAYADNEGYTLFKTDGTSAGTQAVKLPLAGGPEAPGKFVIFKNKLAFIANDQMGNKNVWLSDGTSAGTTKLANAPENMDAASSLLLSTSNYLYFAASNNSSNYGVYRSEGTANSLQKLTGSNFTASDLQPMFVLNNCLLFVGDDGNTGMEPYTICNQQTVGIVPIVNSIDVSVAPNPVSDVLTINTTSANELQVVICSTDGLLTETLSVVNNGRINVAHLASGIYFVQVTDKEGNKSVTRILKQ